MGDRLLALVLAVAVLAVAAPAFSTTYTVNTTLETISDIISVEGDFSFSKVIPGQEYSQNFTVRWAIPQESLSKLGGGSIFVHVLASAGNGSWVRFSKNNRFYKAYAFGLECRVQNYSCAPDSKLSETIEAVVLVPANASTKKESVQFTASLTEEYNSELEMKGVFDILEEQVKPIQNIVPSIQDTFQGVQTALSGGVPSTQSLTQQAAANSSLPAAGLTPFGVNEPTVRANGSKNASSTASSSSADAVRAAADSSENILLDNPLVKPITGFVAREAKDVLFIFGILVIIGLLWLFGKVFPEKPKGLEKE